MTLPNEFMVVGSEEMLKPLILQLLAQHYGGGSSSGGNSKVDRPWFPSKTDKIKIMLKFFGSTPLGTKVEVEKSIRLMKINPATTTVGEIKAIAEKVYSKFDNWTHRTGKMSCNYIDKDKGYQLQQIYVPDLAEGKRLVEQILDIQNDSPDWEYLTYNQSAEPTEAYDDTPDKRVLAGYSIRKPRRRPTGIVNFTEALIRFPGTPNYETLCTRGGYTLDNLDFLKSMADND
jgi:hypothetical protein